MTSASAESNYDAQRMAEDIQSGEEKAPQVNVEKDYERSKEYDVSEIDRSETGVEAASEATTPKRVFEKLGRQ
jgi:hypothetical protein